jgi:hypothetical protein
MSAHTTTRAASSQTNRYASRRWSAAQIVAGLHRMVAFGDSERVAVAHVNSLTQPDDQHTLSRSSLKRMYNTLPASLRHPATSSEGQLLEHIQTYQTERRQQQNKGHTLLTAVEEALLVDWIVRQYNMNAPATPEEVKGRARKLIAERQGAEYQLSLRRWYDAFMRRNAGLALRQPENMPKSRLTAEAKHANIAHFFSLLAEWRSLKPEQLYAADETGLTEDGSRKQKALVPKGTGRVYRNSFGFYEHVSIMHIGNARGKSVPPIWIFKGVAHDADLADDFAAFCGDSSYGAQKNGYFTAAHFPSVLAHFVRHAVTTRPLLLILDGASSHIDEESLQYAKANDINILLLPAHTTHLLQVADVAVFRPFKSYWRQECNRIRAEKRLTCAPGDIGVKRSDILPAAVAAWEYATSPQNVISGFRRTGIYPFNPRAYLKTAASHNKSTSLTSLPPSLLSPLAVADLQQTPAVDQLLHSPSLADPPQPQPNSAQPIKKRVRRTLDTSAGVLLTGDETIALLHEAKEAEAEEAKAKKQRLLDRQEKRAEKEKVTAEKRAARIVKKAEKEAEAAVKAAAKEKKRRMRAEAAETADEDKENVNPNASAAANAATKPARYECTVVKQGRRAVLRMRKSE